MDHPAVAGAVLVVVEVEKLPLLHDVATERAVLAECERKELRPERLVRGAVTTVAAGWLVSGKAMSALGS